MYFVQTRVVKLPEDIAAVIEEGEFIAKRERELITSRHIYENVGDRTFSITIDNRPIRISPDLFQDPNLAQLSRLEENIWEGFDLDDNGTVECALSVDLGNTRTVALIVDKINQQDLAGDSRVDVYPLPMMWCGNLSEAGGDDDVAFESVISLATSDASSVAEFGGDAGRMSFVKLGKNARLNNRNMVKHGGNYTLSSPKRYFWDDDPAQQDWFCALRSVKGGKANTSRIALDGKLPRAFAMAWNSNVAPSRIPTSDMLGGMIAEIYEQAVHYLGSTEFKKKSGDNRNRKIARIHVTYPSTLLPRERAIYVQKLSKGLNCYTDQFSNFPTVELISDVDEASSVLSVFAFSEIRKAGSADFWLRTIGRRFDDGFQARIAVVDIGGGTSDLAIAQVSAYDDEADVQPYKATVNTLYRDGVNRAGDLLIFKFLNDHVKRLAIDAIWKASGSTSTDDEVYRKYNELDSATSKSLTTDFWFKIALEIAKMCDKLVHDYSTRNEGLDIPVAELKDYKFNLGDFDVDPAIFKDVLDHEMTAAEACSIKMTKELVTGFIDSAEAIFGDDAWNFASAISSFDCDELVFSGKTAEFATVQNVYLQRVALPEDAVVSMKDYDIGRWCGMTDQDGRLGDSKIATALGGALYMMKQYQPIGLEFVNDSTSRKCEWGIVAGANITFTRPMFKVGTFDRTVPFSNGRLLIARKFPQTSTATLSYEVRVKPVDLALHGGTVDGDAQVVLCRHDDDSSIAIVGVHGHFHDGIEIAPDQVECRVCSMNGEFAMDKAVEF